MLVLSRRGAGGRGRGSARRTLRRVVQGGLLVFAVFRLAGEVGGGSVPTVAHRIAVQPRSSVLAAAPRSESAPVPHRRVRARRARHPILVGRARHSGERPRGVSPLTAAPVSPVRRLNLPVIRAPVPAPVTAPRQSAGGGRREGAESEFAFEH
jgi:hypothetical protein